MRSEPLSKAEIEHLRQEIRDNSDWWQVHGFKPSTVEGLLATLDKVTARAEAAEDTAARALEFANAGVAQEVAVLRQRAEAAERELNWEGRIERELRERAEAGEARVRELTFAMTQIRVNSYREDHRDDWFLHAAKKALGEE